jgi:hypothetical protein
MAADGDTVLFDLALECRTNSYEMAGTIKALRANRALLIEVLRTEEQGWRTIAEAFKQNGGNGKLVDLLLYRAESLRGIINEEESKKL